MHRLLVADPPRDVTSFPLWKAWSEFFFRPSDPKLVGLLRIGFGLLLLWNFCVLGQDLRSFLGSEGWIGPEAGRQFLTEHAPGSWSFWFFVPDALLPAAWFGCVVVSALFTVGLFGRVTAMLAWVILVSTTRRMPVALYGFDYTLATFLLYLAVFGASTQALSLDAYLKRLKSLRRSSNAGGDDAIPQPSVGSTLTLRLIQLQLVLIYGSSGYWKLLAPEWQNGTAMEMLILTPEFRRFDLTWLLPYTGVLRMSTYAGLLVEISYPVTIWSRRTRWATILTVIGMHITIDLVLGLTEFGLTMIVANLAFVPPDQLQKWFRRCLRSTEAV